MSGGELEVSICTVAGTYLLKRYSKFLIPSLIPVEGAIELRLGID